MLRAIRDNGGDFCKVGTEARAISGNIFEPLNDVEAETTSN